LMIHHEIRPDIFKPDTTKYSYDELVQIINDNYLKVYVYEKDGLVAGHLFYMIHQIEESNNMYSRKELYIDDLCVLDGFRKMGIASELLEFAKQKAKEEGCDYVTLNAWEGNQAIDFYQKRGLKVRKAMMEIKI